MSSLTIRKAKPGEPSLVVHFYYKLFEEQFLFLPSTEKYFLHAMEDYFSDPAGNVLYIAEDEGRIVGSVCIARTGEHDAQLRLFGTSPKLQGKGIGRKLMKMAMDFCAGKATRM